MKLQLYVNKMNLLGPNMDQIANVIIRPSRHLYKTSDLGAKSFVFDGSTVTRSDFQVKNSRNMALKCSFYSKEKQLRSDNILIYLHCNSGCRVQGLNYLRLALENDFSYLLFDFSGSGLSQGKFVSLDLETVINYIKRHIQPDAKFCLWGRSMGAVTGIRFRYKALRFLALNKQSIQVAIFDSPFQSLNKLFIEIGKQRTNLPEILLNVAYKYIKPIIAEKAGYDIDEVDLDPLVGFITSPGIFIASKQDSLIPFEHIDELFNKYKGEKQMFFIEESHNEARNMNVIQKVFKTLKKYLLISEQIQLKKHKTSFYSILPIKDASKKKLELTLKSLSQRQLKSKEPLEFNRPHNVQIDFGTLQKRQASCLFPVRYRRQKKTSECFISNQSESFLETKRQPLAPKHFESENLMPQREEKSKPKFSGEHKLIEIKLKIKEEKEPSGKNKERKTLQHISHKRPPFVELKGVKDVRTSFQLRYRT